MSQAQGGRTRPDTRESSLKNYAFSLRRFSSSSWAVVHVRVLDVRPKTTPLLPRTPRGATRVDTPVRKEEKSGFAISETPFRTVFCMELKSTLKIQKHEQSLQEEFFRKYRRKENKQT